ncbi:MAG: hypothetical protein AAF614_43975 [Chloroflexota bacterium]
MSQDENVLGRLLTLEQTVSYYTPAPSGEPSFVHEPGQIPILLSAPHGTSHRRNGRLKEEDEYTSALVRLVAAETGAHAIYTHFQSDSDPNWDKHSPYKELIRRIVAKSPIHFVLDIHGMSNRHKIGLAVGTINGRSCPPLYEKSIAQLFEQQQFQRISQAQSKKLSQLRWQTFVMNHTRFTGGVKNHTVTRFVSQELRIPAVQLELCASLRVVQRGPHGFARKWPRPFFGDPVGIRQAAVMLVALVNRLNEATKPKVLNGSS